MTENHRIKPVFCFLDESGTIGGNNEKHFALGAIVHPSPDELIESLHKIFDSLVDKCSKHRTAQEFHFTDLTLGTLPEYLRCIDCLEADQSWRFFSVILDLQDPNFQKPADAPGKWACYLRWTKVMLQKNLFPNEKATLIADFYRRPNAATRKLATLPAVVPQLWDVLQIASQGVLLVQMADVLLGASLYEGSSECKIKLAARVREMRDRLPKWRFAEWKVRFRAEDAGR